MINASTLKFLQQLKKNNNKEWFESHRAEFNDARDDFQNFVQEIINGIQKFDPDLKDTEAKKTLFRQHRDIRFSKDKTPYKIHFGAHVSRGGKSSNFGGYYFHLQPGNLSFAGGGIWQPEPNDLKKIRQEIDYSFDEFNKIVTSKNFNAHYGGLEMTPEYMLVKVPKGYEKDNPAAEYLKCKSVIATRMLADEEITKPGFTKSVIKSFEVLMPLVKFINRALIN